MKDYEVSAALVQSLVHRLKEHGKYDAVLAEAGPQVARMAKTPWSENWHPAVLHEALGELVVRIAGPQVFEDLTYHAVKDRFGNIILPLLAFTLKQTNRSPAAIFSKLHSSMPSAIRGLELGWADYPDRGNGGELGIRYPRPVPEHMDLSWRGLFRYVFEVTEKVGKIVAFERGDDGAVLRYRFEW